MTLAPLLSAPAAIQIHVAFAVVAFGFGVVQLTAPKGTFSHRTLGYVWSAMMLIVAAGSFWIHTINQWNGFSLIHILSVITLVSVPLAIFHARRHRVANHRRVMQFVFAGGLATAGLFTLVPGRIMYKVFFGA